MCCVNGFARSAFAFAENFEYIREEKKKAQYIIIFYTRDLKS